jgi:HAD superfamily hydrolase (TIGR01484 family)
MRPISELTPDIARRLRFVLTDIDDTITSDGALPARAYAALEHMRDSGLSIIPVTGRPAGWCDMIARFWPVAAVIGENGALYFSYDRERKVMKRRYSIPAEQRAIDRKRLNAIRDQILREIPGAAVASDQDFRIADLAIDFCEDVPALPASAVDRIVAIFTQAGAHAKVSSIHVNGWFGEYDKRVMTGILMKEQFGLDLDQAKELILFSGDSPNDEPMFSCFPVSVGVANICDAVSRFKTLPAYITRARGGDGFVEIAEALVTPRGLHRNC